MKTSLAKSLVIALLITVGINTQISAQKNCCGGNCCGVSNLKDDQKTKIEALCTDHAKKNLVFQNQLQEKKAQLNTLMTADKADMAAINKVIDEIGKIKTDMMKANAAHKQEIRKILDDKQRLEFDLKMTKHGFCDGPGKHGKGMQGKGCDGGYHGGPNKDAQGCQGHQYGKGQGKCDGTGPQKNIPKNSDVKTE